MEDLAAVAMPRGDGDVIRAIFSINGMLIRSLIYRVDMLRVGCSTEVLVEKPSLGTPPTKASSSEQVHQPHSLVVGTVRDLECTST